MPETMTRIVVGGAAGRMGQAILRIAAEDSEIEVVGGLETASKFSETSRFWVGEKSYPMASTLSKLDAVGAVLIEFTTPEATRLHLNEAIAANVKLVIGTTGLCVADQTAIRAASQRIAVLIAANMSAGINVLLGVVSQVSGALSDYDIEIVEMHHRMKADSPSGTALALGESAAAGRGEKFATVVRHGREGITGIRPTGEIGMHAVRGGDVTGDHTVIFAGPGERIEIIHRAQSRDTFAVGALRAAKFLATKDTGFYTMKDVLGL